MTVVSPDITDLEFSVLFDVSKVPPEVVLTNRSTVVNAAALDWWFVITTPSGSPIHTGNGTTPDINNAPFTTVTYNTWPQPMGQIEWGYPYTVDVYVKDSAGNTFTLQKTATIIRPLCSTTKTKNNFGAASVIADMRCERAQLYVEDTTNYSWNGINPTFIDRTWILVYPLDATDVQPPDFVLTGTNNALIPVTYSGSGYQIVRRVTAEYDEKNGVKVRIKYKYTKDFEVQCDLDLCQLTCEYEKLLAATEGGTCDQEATNTLVTINGLINLALIAKTQPLCGINVGSIIDQIKELGGFTCDCGNTGTGGVNGAAQGGTIGMTVTATGGDLKVGLLTVTGSNILLEMYDSTYQFQVDKTVPGSLAQGFTFGVQTSPSGFLKTITLTVDDQAAKNWISSWINTVITIPQFSPSYLNVVMRGTSNMPASCPQSPYPLQLWSTDGLQQLDVVEDVNELIAALTADPGWGALAFWAQASNCQVAFWPKPGQTGIPNIQVTGLAYSASCINNKRNYIFQITTRACGGNMRGVVFPYDLRISYGGPAYFLNNVLSYTDMITRLNSQPNKPAHITYEAIGTDETAFLVRDTNCTANTVLDIKPSLARELFYAIASGQNFGTLSGAFLAESKGPNELAIVCGSPTSSERPWHSIRVGDLIYYVDTMNGVIHRMDITNPLSPIHATTVLLPNTIAGHGALGPTPYYNGNSATPSYFDVYFQTDINTTGGGFLYIVESVSGFIWKYSLGSDTVVGFDWNALLMGRLGRSIFQGSLWLSLDGSRGIDTGAVMTNTDRMHQLVLSSISMTPGSSNVVANPAALVAGEEIWAVTWDGKRSCYWATTRNGSLVKTTYGGVLQTSYPGMWGVTFGGVVNTHIFGDKIYASDMVNGTRWIDLNNPVLATAFDPLLLSGTTYNAHYNFIVPNGACYGLVTAEGGTGSGTRGVTAKYSLEGKLLSPAVSTVFGNVYNLIPVYNTVYGYPNGLCT